ncbi:MAG: methyl-accepting chemotaxis protein [Candidatus Endobugula sp.]|jgi:methyl-accepting chemotaxis protein
MNIQTKLLIGTCTLITIALAFTSLSISYTAGVQSSKALKNITLKELVSLRVLTAQGIEDYFNLIKGTIQIGSSNPRLIEYTNTFRTSFSSYSDEATGLPDAAKQKSAVKNFYENQYGKEYSRVNGKAINTGNLVNQLSNESITMQYQYIVNNSQPLGNKELFDGVTNDETAYSRAHKEFHPHSREMLYHYGFYDIFIADIDTGNIIYSVYKELDYATSLINGPYANSGIGEAFKKAANASNPEYVYLTDFNEYQPSYSSSAAFMSSPIYDGAKKIGVLIFQMPIDKINSIMTQHNKWEQAGLGLSGETILAAKDGSARSNTRAIIEDLDGFINTLRTKELASADNINRIEKLEHNIGLFNLNTPAIDQAIADGAGTMQYIKYTDEEVLVAYDTVTVLNQEWVVLSEMNLREALVPTKALLSSINTTAIITALAAITLSLIAAYTFAKILMKPLQRMIELVSDLAKGDGNLTKRLDVKSDDETGILAGLINEFMDKILALVNHVNAEAKNLKSIALTMDTIASDNAKGAEQQHITAQQVNHSIVEMNLAASESAESATCAEQAASQAMEATNEGTEIMNSTSNSIQIVANNVEEAVAIIKELENTSETIGSVVGVINGIAEQTNLLALNAAIEAARAGEQGRGFAVVADEVRALASRTQESTLEINSIIEKLQQNANTAVNVMSSGQDAVHSCVSEAEKAQAALHSIQAQISDINAMNLRIATSAEEQSAVSETVKGNVAEITEISNKNNDGANIAIDKAREMTTSIDTLNVAISQFSIAKCDVK